MDAHSKETRMAHANEIGSQCTRGAAGDREPKMRFLAALMMFAASASAHATQFETADPDLKIRWDNTLKYSTAFRVKAASQNLANAQNFAGFAQDDGNRNFSRGLISNRIDLLSEFDASYKSFGVRLSGAAWYDDVYNRSNDFPLAATSPFSPQDPTVAHDHFPKKTRELMGRNAELLDAFVYDRF